MKELFAGRHFDREIIVLCVRWYLRYKLGLRDLVEMIAERGLDITRTTIMRWVQRYVPEFEKRWNGYASKSGRLWRVEEIFHGFSSGCCTHRLRYLPVHGVDNGAPVTAARFRLI
jgi:transposase-like protein